MPASERSSSQKRERPSERSRTSRSVHLPQMTSAVRQTGHVGSDMHITLPNEVSAVEEVSEPAAGARSARDGLDPPRGGLHEHPALPGERHLHRLARAAADEAL